MRTELYHAHGLRERVHNREETKNTQRENCLIEVKSLEFNEVIRKIRVVEHGKWIEDIQLL